MEELINFLIENFTNGMFATFGIIAIEQTRNLLPKHLYFHSRKNTILRLKSSYKCHFANLNLQFCCLLLHLMRRSKHLEANRFLQ